MMEINDNPKTIKTKQTETGRYCLKDAHLWEEVKVSIKSGITLCQMVINTPFKIAIPKR